MLGDTETALPVASTAGAASVGGPLGEMVDMNGEWDWCATGGWRIPEGGAEVTDTRGG